MMSWPTAARRASVLCCLIVAAGACRDVPTGPAALEQWAGGELWAAMEVPANLPSLAAWRPYLDRSTAEGERTAAYVDRLEEEARLARHAGQSGRAAALQREAVRLAVLSLGRHPDPRLLQNGLYALDEWADRVEATATLERAPTLAASLRAVRAARAATATALRAGDTTSAVLQLATAAERVREHAPEAVALRVLQRVESRLRALPVRTPSVARALHLVGAARAELVGGDPSRALRRALYALQLAEGYELRLPPEEPAGPCPRGGC